ncbi:molecular chaperone TorD family protein [Eggerthella sinensis]|uniref:molecular chaperone TorD family protein n=1 Tax=Eggerthella sinensis TaxID=242230 RepID=UPI001D0745E4|nr:molecular chaperone TorD family protein [Eggerthella sinensis]MCB7036879.1 molecular chaperone TorD family protein [Eggerthella sinensis]
MNDASTFHDTVRRVHGCSVLLSACAAALINEPTEQVVRDVRRVAEALGDSRFDGIEPGAPLTQRYYDRFFVSASPYFVPLVESCVRGAFDENGRTVYASTRSSKGDHALLCYEAAGFDYRALRGFEAATKALKPDSLACELAFLAALGTSAAQADDEACARAGVRLFDEFAREHVGAWIPRAARCLAAADDDFYARLVALAAEAVQALAGRG